MENKLRAATFNIGGYEIEDRVEALKKSIGEMITCGHIELFGFNEWPSKSLRLLTNVKGSQFKALWGEKAHNFYNPIFYGPTLEPIDWQGFVLHTREQFEDASADRTATWAKMRVKKSGFEFGYLNAHLDNKSDEAKQHSVRKLLGFVDKQPHDLPIIMAGDFNMNIARVALNMTGPTMHRLILAAGFVDCLAAGNAAAPARRRPRTIMHHQGSMHCGEDKAETYDLDVFYIRHLTHWLCTVNEKPFGVYPSDHAAVMELMKY
ncbi:MAG: Endonuclease/exonuclease/phosphatase [Parcubacteria group bacterium]|nr:Endonuclease/exonuclease/phosphatase [Parcubacteria group bacterium]